MRDKISRFSPTNEEKMLHKRSLEHCLNLFLIKVTNTTIATMTILIFLIMHQFQGSVVFVYLYSKQVTGCPFPGKENTSKCASADWFYYFKIFYRCSILRRIDRTCSQTTDRIIFYRTVFITNCMR